MLNLSRAKQNVVQHCCFISKGCRLVIFCLFYLLLVVPSVNAKHGQIAPQFPVDMDNLLNSLSVAQVPELDNIIYPRTVKYNQQRWNTLDDTLSSNSVTVRLDHQPQRILPNAVGLTEVLMAIVPPQRIVAVHKSCRNSAYSFLADRLPQSLPSYGSQDAEIVIGYHPDLVLTTYYTSAAFKNCLSMSHVDFVEMGFFGDIASIESQIRFLGDLVGAEKSADNLIATMEHNVAAIQREFNKRMNGRSLRVLYYDRSGFVAGKYSTFDSLCRVLGVENVASQNGIKFFKQIDYETVLKWDPDIIIVPQNSGLVRSLVAQPILATAKAVCNKNIRTIPGVYLMASSQYAVASLNYLGGILYEK